MIIDVTNFHYPTARILQFSKAPVAGRVKTRLIPALGEQGVCELHRRLTAHVLAEVVNSKLASVELYSDSPEHKCVKEWADQKTIALYPQVAGDLGAKMAAAIGQALQQPGVSAVVLVGSDCPGINADYLRKALEALEQGCDLVLGPASDGGYVLIGMKRVHNRLFEGINWGSDTVLQATLKKAHSAELKTVLLSEQHDIDRPGDLPLLDKFAIALPQLV